MDCWNCSTQLIWGGDTDLEDDEDHKLMTNLSCPTCKAFVVVYYNPYDEEYKSIEHNPNLGPGH